MSENLALRRLLLLVEVLQRVGHHEVNGFVHFHIVSIFLVIGVTLNLVLGLGVLHAELRSILLVLCHLLFTLFTVGFTHTVLHILRACGDVFAAKRTVLDLLLIFLLNASELVDSDTTLHQLGNDLLTRYTFRILFNHVVHHLIVGHARLSPACGDRKCH